MCRIQGIEKHKGNCSVWQHCTNITVAHALQLQPCYLRLLYTQQFYSLSRRGQDTILSFNHGTMYLLMSTNNCLCRNPVWLDDRSGLLGSHSRLTRLAHYLLRVRSHRPLLGGAVDDARRQQPGGSHLHLSEGAVVCSALTSYHCSRQCCEYRNNVPYEYDE